jgi:hypothetical protein
LLQRDLASSGPAKSGRAGNRSATVLIPAWREYIQFFLEVDDLWHYGPAERRAA